MVRKPKLANFRYEDCVFYAYLKNDNAKKSMIDIQYTFMKYAYCTYIYMSRLFQYIGGYKN